MIRARSHDHRSPQVRPAPASGLHQAADQEQRRTDPSLTGEEDRQKITGPEVGDPAFRYRDAATARQPGSPPKP
jgi:hypothetical protein